MERKNVSISGIVLYYRPSCQSPIKGSLTESVKLKGDLLITSVRFTPQPIGQFLVSVLLQKFKATNRLDVRVVVRIVKPIC